MTSHLTQLLMSAVQSNSSSGSGAGSSSGSYSTIGKISGSAIEQATGLLKNFEGFSNKAYWDVNAYRTGYGLRYNY